MIVSVQGEPRGDTTAKGRVSRQGESQKTGMTTASVGQETVAVSIRAGGGGGCRYRYRVLERWCGRYGGATGTVGILLRFPPKAIQGD